MEILLRTFSIYLCRVDTMSVFIMRESVKLWYALFIFSEFKKLTN